MNRIVSLVLIISLILTLAAPVMAAESESTVTPRYNYIANISATLKVNASTGLSACNATSYVPGADSVILSSTLQRHNGSSWSNVKKWSVTGTSACTIIKNYAVYSGYTYRLRVTCSVYSSSGTLLESGTCYSNQVVY